MTEALPGRVAASRATVEIKLTHFQLPPVASALLVGRKSAIGAQAMAKALHEMAPGVFEVVKVDHSALEAVIVRTSHLRKLPPDRLIALLIERVEPMIDESDTIHVDLKITIELTEELEL